ncbi:hypothetical protein NM688_g7402 [Phlebia brevispora]|uniref:Uncharacterized protein n=1 Tax=Phlebia brevispora TaxID=194682 RepID=A0ACC1S5K0_9APHY|nr:hypothetical protein NM688_g7402 [Phlebia brevispora]
MTSDSEEVDGEEEKLLAMYIAKYNPQREGRRSSQLYQELMKNEKARHWATKRDWKIWRTYYIENQARLDSLIAKRLKDTTTQKAEATKKAGAGGTRRTIRIEFTPADDAHLVQYIAIENPLPNNRQGKALYERLVANADGLWPWATRHTAQSWRDRYVKHTDVFNGHIRRFMKKEGFTSSDVETTKERRAMWAKLSGEGDRPSTPQPGSSRTRLNVTNGARPSKQTDRLKVAAAPRDDAPMSAKAKGKRRASSETDDDRVLKKKRVEKPIATIANAEDNTIGQPEAGPSHLMNRVLSVSQIAFAEPASMDKSPSDVQEEQLQEEQGDGESHQPGPPTGPMMEAENLDLGPQLQGSNTQRRRSPPDDARSPHPIAAEAMGTAVEVHDVPFGSPLNVPNPSEDPYPTTSTPRDGAQPLLSQVIPTPRTLEALTAKESVATSGAAQIVQEPTPPTSHSPQLPAPSSRGLSPEAPGAAQDERQSEDGDARQKSVPHRSSVSPPYTPTPIRFPLRKRKLLKGDDFFATPEPDAVPLSTPRKHRARQLPVRAEGVWNSAITDLKGLSNAIKKGARRVNGVGGDAEDASEDEEERSADWPPKRRKAQIDGAQKPAKVLKPVVRKSTPVEVKSEDEDAELPGKPQVPGTKHHPFSQPTQQAEASSSVQQPLRNLPKPAEQSSGAHHPFSQPTQVAAPIARTSASPHPFSEDDEEAPHTPERISKTYQSRLTPPRTCLAKKPVPRMLAPFAFSITPTVEDDQSAASPQT